MGWDGVGWGGMGWSGMKLDAHEVGWGRVGRGVGEIGLNCHGEIGWMEWNGME